MSKKIIIFIFVLMSGLAVASTFVVKKKNSSTAVRKEECCAQMADLLKTFPGILTLVAEIQDVEITTLCAYFEGSKTNILAAATPTDLILLSEKMEKLQEDMLAARKSLQEFAHYLNQLPTKKK
jgi:hypothetical protein